MGQSLISNTKSKAYLICGWISCPGDTVNSLHVW